MSLQILGTAGNRNTWPSEFDCAPVLRWRQHRAAFAPESVNQPNSLESAALFVESPPRNGPAQSEPRAVTESHPETESSSMCFLDPLPARSSSGTSHPLQPCAGEETTHKYLPWCARVPVTRSPPDLLPRRSSVFSQKFRWRAGNETSGRMLLLVLPQCFSRFVPSARRSARA